MQTEPTNELRKASEVLNDEAEARELSRIDQFVEQMAASKQGGMSVADRRRLYRRLLRSLRDVERPRRLTKPGYAVQPTDKPFEWKYQLTPREVNRRRNRRKMQSASRRANRP